MRATVVLLAALAGAGGLAQSASRDLGPNENALYVKECGACHFAYQPGLLPERSWRRLMSSLTEHFGESADLKTPARDEITRYLAADASDRHHSPRSTAVDASIPSGETPTRVTQVPYISGIHGGLLDPRRMGRPAVRSIVDCSACHPAAERGNYEQRRYTVSDEAFRATR